MEKIELVKKLIEDFNGDSKKKSEQAEEDLIREIEYILDKSNKIAKKYKISYWDVFDPNRGSLKIIFAEKDTIEIEYSDSWSYGGHLKETKTITVSDFFSSKYLDKLEKRSIKLRNTELRRKYASLTREKNETESLLEENIKIIINKHKELDPSFWEEYDPSKGELKLSDYDIDENIFYVEYKKDDVIFYRSFYSDSLLNFIN